MNENENKKKSHPGEINNKTHSLQPNLIFAYLFSNINPFPNIHPQLTLKHIAEEVNTMFDNKLISMTNVSSNNQISLMPVDEELKLVLNGGFYYSHSYEIKGPSLSGKTLLINTLLFSNMNRIKKCIFFDFIGTNLWKIDWENKIEIVSNLYSISEVVQFIRKIPIGKYDVVIFDPLAIILSKELEYNSATIKEFTHEINILLYKKSITIIYTSSVRQCELFECFDEITKRSWFEREYESTIPLLFLPINKTEICLYRKHNDDKQHFFIGNLYANVLGCNSENNYLELPSLSG